MLSYMYITHVALVHHV